MIFFSSFDIKLYIVINVANDEKLNFFKEIY